MAASSLSVVTNANRLRRYRPAALPEPGEVQTDPHVETHGSRAGEDQTGVTGPVTDPVCAMTVDPAAAEHRDAGAGTVYFCSAHCAAAFDTDPGRFTHAATTAPGAAAR